MLRTIRKLLRLFDTSERPALVGVVLAMIATGVLQTVGIASIMPFLAVVSNPDLAQQHPALAWAYRTFGFQTRESFLIALGVLFLLVMVASNGAAALTAWATVRLQWRSHRRLSHRLLERYLSAPYGFHAAHNSARLARALLEEVNAVVSQVFIPATRVLTQGISALLIISLLVWADPLLAPLSAIFVGGFYAVFYGVIRKKQRRLGEEAAIAKTERFRSLSEAFGGIKELKVLAREDSALRRFDAASERLSRAAASNSLVGLVPRFALETIAYGGIIVVILYLIQTRASLVAILPTLAVYALSANRLIPALQDVFLAVTQISFSAPAVDTLYADLHGLPGSPVPELPEPVRDPVGGPAPLRFDRRVRFEQVSFVYPGRASPALSEIDLEIPFGSSVALVGSTGAGKTTLVDLLLGLYLPTEGRILIDDEVLDPTTLPSWRAKVGYVPQFIFLADTSIAGNIAFGVPEAQRDAAAVQRAAQIAQLDSFVATLPTGFETVVGERGVRLSGGQRQRIGIARALYHNPEILILDEATSALDNVTEEQVMAALRVAPGKRTVVLIAHRLTTVRHCPTIYVFERGRIVAQGDYDSLASSNRIFRALARVK